MRLFALFALVAANAGFVAAEFALVAADRTKLSELVEQNDASAIKVRGLVDRLSYHLSGAQLGITITSLVLGFIAEPTVAALLEPPMKAIFGDGLSSGWSIALGLSLATVFQMVLGELVPKTVATSSPYATAKVLTPLIVGYGIIAQPVVSFLDNTANKIVRRFGIEPRHDIDSTPDRIELEQMIRSSGEEGVLDAGEVELLTRSIRLADKTAADALVPRVEVTAIQSDATVADLVGLATTTGHSRFPVMGEDIDDITGVVHIKAVHSVAGVDRATTLITDLITPVPAFPETRDLDELLVDLREGGSQLAIVVDEHGGTAGIITLEDILEELVGEIDDEYDERSHDFTNVEASGSYVIPASLHPDEVRDATGFVMPDGEYETLAGMILAHLGHIPEPAEMVTIDGWRFEVVAMDRLRIATARVVAPPDPTPSTDGDDQ